MRWHHGVLALAFWTALATGCTEDFPGDQGPFASLPLKRTLGAPGLTADVHIARDRFGIAHIYAQDVGDLGYAQGYVMAHDRLPQMDLLRRFGAGTLSNIFGAVVTDIISGDLKMRMHRMRPIAVEAYAELLRSDDPSDVKIVRLLDRFADGVNAYADDLRNRVYTLDFAISSIRPQDFEPWSPIDSLVLGRFQSFSLSFDAPTEIAVTDIYEAAAAVFDGASSTPAFAARAGAAADFIPLRPVGLVPTIDGFPNLGVDSGSRSNGKARRAMRPRIPPELLRSALATFASGGRPDPQRLGRPLAGSNAWAVGATLAGGKGLLAGDQHLDLSSPSVFYPTHLIVPGEVDVAGITFPGIPGVILGRNADLAWSSTVVAHDVADVYLETIVPCSSSMGDCVLFDGRAVPIEKWTEEVDIGILGNIVRTITVTYELVPHHGPIIPIVENGNIVERTSNQALSIRYTGYDLTQELRAVFALNRATSIRAGFEALDHFEYGGQNWVMLQSDGTIGWTGHAKIPVRSAAAHTFHPTNNPNGTAPFMVLPGDGSAEWEGFLSPRYVPHVVAPEQGYIATANSDPVGATFDGDPLNQTQDDGSPLYLGALYASGMRTERIDQRIREVRDRGDAMTTAEMESIQADSRSNLGARLRPGVMAAIVALDATTKADVVAWAGSLTATQLGRLHDAGDRLAAWTLDAAAGVEGSPGSLEIADSVATSIFNVWLVHFLDLAIGDELVAMQRQRSDLRKAMTARLAEMLLIEPESLVSGLSPQTGEPILCDSLDTTSIIESCTLIVLQALHAALTWLEGPDAFDTDDMQAWRWGALHTLTFNALDGTKALRLPAPDEPDPARQNGFPRPGDNFAINRGDSGLDDLDFRHEGHGAAQRFLAEADGGLMRSWMSLPGGVIFDRDSPHYRDLLDDYYLNHTTFEVPFQIPSIVANGEERWVIEK